MGTQVPEPPAHRQPSNPIVGRSDTDNAMYKDITGPITIELANAETNRLFDEPVTDLPNELIARGWKLIARVPGRMFAVSAAYGCTSTRATIHEVIAEARAMDKRYR